MKKNILYILPLMVFVGCTSNDLTESVDNNPANEIRVTTGVGNIVSTRGEGMINNALTGDLQVSAIRLDESGDPLAYPADYTGVVAKNATVKVVSSANVMSFDTPEYYLASGAKTKLIAWYPRIANNSGANSNKVSFTIDGSTDIMFTGFAEGDKGKTSGIAANALTFKHLLTQISVKVYADDTSGAGTEIAKKWGGLESILITGMKQTLEVTLPTSNQPFTDPTTLTTAFSGTDDLPLVKKTPSGQPSATTKAAIPADAIIPGTTNTSAEYGTGNVLNIPVGTAAAALTGYAMFQPGTYSASSPLILKVKTKDGGEQEAKITQQIEAGKAYTVILKFTASTIAPTVQITDWEIGTVTGGDIEM